MSRRLPLKTDNSNMPLIMLFITVTFKWLFEGVFGQVIIELFFLAAIVFFLIVKKTSGGIMRISRPSMVWLLYILNIAVSVLTHNPTLGVIVRASIIILIASFVFFIDSEPIKYKDVVRCLILISAFYGVFVLLQFLIGKNFNNFYFRFTEPFYSDLGNFYFNKGYCFGLIVNVHEIAGLTAFSSIALILWMVIYRKWNIRIAVLAAFFVFALLLTQKKGVIILAVIVLVFTLLIQFGSKKQWHRVLLLFFILIAAGLIIWNYVLPNTDLAFFRRFQELIENIANGDNIDSGRTPLYDIAISEWQDHKLFGVGWRHFNGLTTSVYGYDFGHEVNRDYLQWLCETGIVGLILNLIPVIVTLYRTIYICRHSIRKIRNTDIQWVVLFAVFIQLFIVVYAWIEIPFYDIIWFSMYIFSCIVINSTYSRVRKRTLESAL